MDATQMQAAADRGHEVGRRSTWTWTSGPSSRPWRGPGATSVESPEGEVEGFAFGGLRLEGTGDVPPTESVSLGLRKSAGGNTSGVVFLQFTFKLVAVK